MARVYALEILVIDHEMVGEDEIIRKLEDSCNFQGLKVTKQKVATKKQDYRVMVGKYISS
jgi:hypothetical protein